MVPGGSPRALRKAVRPRGCPQRSPAARGLRSRLATGAARAGAPSGQQPRGAERAAGGDQPFYAARCCGLHRSMSPPARPPPGALMGGRARRPLSFAGSPPPPRLSRRDRAPAPPSARQGPAARVPRGAEHVRCAAGDGEGGAEQRGRGSAKRGAPDEAASPAAVCASASCRSARRAARGGWHGPCRGESGEPRRRSQGGEACPPCPRCPRAARAGSGEPAVPAAARAAAGGERARCRAGRSRPAPRSPRRFPVPPGKKTQGTLNLEVSC